MTFPAGTFDNLCAVTGDTALVSSEVAIAHSALFLKTFRIMSFADPLHPAIEREFGGVTAISQDEKRGLIFLANHEGIWVLQQRHALSPEDEKFQKEIEHSIFDTR